MKTIFPNRFWPAFWTAVLFTLLLQIPLQGVRVADNPDNTRSKISEKKHFWRALIETSVWLGINHLKYNRTHTIWVEEVHKYQRTWEDQKKRLFNPENWNYDANCFHYNWTHVLAGGIYYNLSRTNNLSILESLLMSWASSSYWELIVEYRSDISINDHIFTPLGGLSVGEVWYQLGQFFSSRPDTLSQILSFINPFLKLNQLLNGRRETARSNLPSAGWHDFHIDTGMRLIQSGKDAKSQAFPFAAVNAQIFSLQNYGEPGTESRFIPKPLFSGFEADVTGLGRGFEEFNIKTRVVLFGFVDQKIDAQKEGHSLIIGGGSAFSVFKKKAGTTEFPCTFKGRNAEKLKLDEPRDFRDKMAAVHIMGPVLDWTRFGKDFTLRIAADMYIDFAIAHSLPFNTYTQNHDYSGVKTPLLVNGYYYGWGGTLSATVDVSWKSWRLNGSTRFHSYGSIDGKDRFQHLVTDDFHLSDSWLFTRTALSYRIPQCPLEMKVAYESLFRRGKIETLREHSREDRFFLGISLVY